MRIFYTFLFSILFCSLLTAQKNSIRLDIRNFSDFNRNTTVIGIDSQDTLNSPPSIYKRKAINLSLTYFRELKKYNVFLGGGISLGKDFSDNSINENGFSFISISTSHQKKIQLISGIQKSIKITESKLLLNVSTGIALDYSFQNENLSAREIYDSLGIYQQGFEIDIKIANDFSIVPRLELAFSYPIFQNLSIGLSQVGGIAYQYRNGKNIGIFSQFGIEKELIESFQQEDDIKLSFFSKFHYSTIFLFYHF